MSNRLPVLAAEIRRAHVDVQESAKTSAEKAIEAGHKLIEAKDLVKHGEWLSFLEGTAIHERTARNYMALARSGIKSETVADLGGIRAALAYIAKRKLPSPGTSLTAYPDHGDYAHPVIVVWQSPEHPGFYHLAALFCDPDDNPRVEWTDRPISGESEAAIWLIFETMAAPHLQALDMTMVPDMVPVKIFGGLLDELAKDVGGAS